MQRPGTFHVPYSQALDRGTRRGSPLSRPTAQARAQAQTIPGAGYRGEPGFAEAARRQSLTMASSRHAEIDQASIDSISEVDGG